MHINYNGTLSLKDAFHFSAENRAFKYGDAVFDTLKYTQQKILFWEEHYLRLMASMRILRMEIPISFTLEFLENEITNLLKINQLENGSARIRITIFRNDGGLYLPSSNQINFFIEAEKLTAPFYELNENRYEVELFKDFYVQPDLLATVKHTNRLINVLGSVFAYENDYQNCILLNNQKNVCSFLNGNLFLVEGNTIKTPPLTDGCLNGITRKIVLKMLAKVPDYQVIETSVSPFELQKADELFLTNSVVGIQPVTHYRKTEYKTSVVKSLIGKLNTVVRFGM